MISSARSSPRRGRVAARATVAIVCIIFVAVVIGVIMSSGGEVEEQEQDAVEQGTDSLTVDLPADDRISTIEFSSQKGEEAVVSLDMDLLFDASTEDRRGAYVAIGVYCADVAGNGSTQGAGGTQNLLFDDPTSLRTQFVYTTESSGDQRCNVNFRAPNWDPDFGDATTSIDTTVTVTDSTPGFAHEAVPTSAEPLLPSSGESVTAVDETVDVPEDLEWIELAATSHMTTCTIENGSRDQTDENLCTPDILDERGSTVDVTSSVEVLDDGEVCRRFEMQENAEHISHQVHHRLLSFAPARIELPDGLCGDSIRMVQTVENDGPAPVVVHRGPSNIVVSGG